MCLKLQLVSGWAVFGPKEWPTSFGIGEGFLEEETGKPRLKCRQVSQERDGGPGRGCSVCRGPGVPPVSVAGD